MYQGGSYDAALFFVPIISVLFGAEIMDTLVTLILPSGAAEESIYDKP